MAEPRKIPKSRFKPRALEYFRLVETTGEVLIITDRGKPVLKILRYDEDPRAALEALRHTVLRFDDPAEPVADDDWEALR